MTKVSVIVAAYCPGDGLNRVIASLDAQTLPQDEFESIFVDDGSPDDTLERLQALAATRPNMRVTSIPNSGWPCRPRNVGIEMAVGDYVTFMDHDDELYPDALRSAYEFGVANDVDVVNAKECHTGSWFWGFQQYQQDRVEGADPAALLAMMPHKLYRRSLLEEHGVRFLEGGRILYEDILFNLEVAARAERVGVLSSRPFYKWVDHAENNSGSYGEDADEIVQALDRVLDLVQTLDLGAEARDFMVLHTYRLRVLTQMLGAGLAVRGEEWKTRTFTVLPGFLDKHVPARFDALVGPFPRARAELLRAGRFDLLCELAEHDRGVTATLDARDIGWSPSGEIAIAGDVVWRRGESPWLLEREGDRVRRQLPAELEEALTPEAVDLTSALREAQVSVLVKSAEDSCDWSLPTQHQVHLDEVAGGCAPRLSVRSRTALDRAVFDRPLDPGAWKVGCRVEMFGGVRQGAVRYDGPARPALLGGRVATLAADKRGRLVIRVDAAADEILDATRLAVNEGAARRLGLRGVDVSIPVHGVAVAGETSVPLLARLQPLSGDGPVEVPAVLVGDAAGARLELRVPRLAPGRYRLAVETSAADRPGRRYLTPAVVTRTRTGRTGLERVPVRGRRKRVWGRGVDLPADRGAPAAAAGPPAAAAPVGVADRGVSA